MGELELDAVVRQDGVDFIGHSGRGLSRFHLAVLEQQLGISKLAGAINGDEQIEFAFFRTHFSNVDMEIADEILSELFPGIFLAFYLRQAANVVALEQTVR